MASPGQRLRELEGRYLSAAERERKYGGGELTGGIAASLRSSQ